MSSQTFADWDQSFVASATSGGRIFMANTYTSLHYHVIFSTKNRYPWLVPDIEQRIWKFIGGIARTAGVHDIQT